MYRCDASSRPKGLLPASHRYIAKLYVFPSLYHPPICVSFNELLGATTILTQGDTQAIRAVLEPIVDPDAVLCSDGNAIYRAFSKQVHIVHKPINLSAGIRVVDHAFHIQNVNAYDSRLKTWMIRFHGVATQYLPNYLGWRRCLERFAETLTPSLLLAQALHGDQHLMQT